MTIATSNFADTYFEPEDIVAIGDHVKSTLDSDVLGEDLDGSNEYYAIRVQYRFNLYGDPYLCYAIVNRETNVAEADCRQLHAAKEWVRGLSELLTVDDETRDEVADLLDSIAPPSPKTEH